MEIRVGVARQVIVDSQVDALDIYTTTEDIGSDADTLVELLELLVTFDTEGEKKAISRENWQGGA